MPDHLKLYFAHQLRLANRRREDRSARTRNARPCHGCGGNASSVSEPSGAPKDGGGPRGGHPAALGDGGGSRGGESSDDSNDFDDFGLGSFGDLTGCRGCKSLVQWGESAEQKAMVVKLGYLPEVPDHRDFQFNSARTRWRRAGQGAQILKRLFPPKGQHRPAHVLDGAALPEAVNLLELVTGHWPVDDQGQLGSCTANAVVGALEFLSRVQAFQPVDLSRLFLYDSTLRLLGWTGDAGAYIRSTIKAAAAFGVPPEEVWPYDPAELGTEPDAYAYAYAADTKALRYFRADGYGNRGSDTLKTIKQLLADGYPVAFGFPVYDCIQDARPDIPFPNQADRLIGGHAVLAVGYGDAGKKTEAVLENEKRAEDLRKDPTNTKLPKPRELPDLSWLKEPKVPSILIRNSWGREWGYEGYGWLPEQYVTDELASDFWTIFKQSWISGT